MSGQRKAIDSVRAQWLDGGVTARPTRHGDADSESDSDSDSDSDSQDGGGHVVSEYLGQDRQRFHGHEPGIGLTGRGAIVVMAVVFALGVLLSAWLNLAVITGVAYVAGALVAARYTRPAHLLAAAVSPPLLFALALAVVKLITASGNTLVSAGSGMFLALAGAAPWLLGGTAAALIVTWLRGLPDCVADLRRDLHGDSDWQARTEPAPRHASAPRRP